MLGGVLWGAGITTLGYFLGEIDFIKNNIEFAIIVIVGDLGATGRNRIVTCAVRRSPHERSDATYRLNYEIAAAIAGALRFENATAPMMMTSATPAMR